MAWRWFVSADIATRRPGSTRAPGFCPIAPSFRTRWRESLRRRPTTRFATGRAPWPLVQELMKGNQTTVVGETMAMALAELGQFSDAVDVQKGVIAASQQTGPPRMSAG